MSIIARIKSLAEKEAQFIRENRRYIHAHPELSFQEYETSNFIAQRLREYGLFPQRNITKTGVVALIKGNNPEIKTVALRADIDALPIQEVNKLSYKSQNCGIMHACGHDVHTSCLLGSASILNQLKDEFDGTVKLIFQPGEEKLPGGASLMIKAGVLQDPSPKAIFAQHVGPEIPVGKVAFRSGAVTASVDELYLIIKGKGGHAAKPETCIDPILISAHILIALQQIVSRMTNPQTPCVLSFGDIHAYGATNIIPNDVKIKGTFRTMDENWRKKAHRKMKKMAEEIAESMSGKCLFEIQKGCPSVINDSELTKKAKSAAIEYMKKENVISMDISMGGEDFSFFLHKIPGCFYRLGIRNEAKKITSGLHTSTFNIDEEALEIGAGLMSWLVLNELNNL